MLVFDGFLGIHEESYYQLLMVKRKYLNPLQFDYPHTYETVSNITWASV